MASFSLVIEYLTGYAVATDPSSRERPEWPPHPARVYMALAAAHFETDGSPEDKHAEREALEWLATLPPPELIVPSHCVRDVLAVYVPVNDQSGGDALARRSRQPRTFPRVHVGNEPVRFIWRVDPEAFSQHVRSLEGICRCVTRIGHSSSLVWIRIERHGGDMKATFIPDDQGLSHRLRVVSQGTLGRLELLFNRDAIDTYARLDEAISQSKGAKKKKLKQQKSEEFPNGQPTSQRPVISLYQGYRIPVSETTPAEGSNFDSNFIILRCNDDATQTFGVESTVQIADALRGAILATFGNTPIPAWVSGHEANGEKLKSRSHLAIAPLPFVASKYADGHLLGMAIMVPKDVPLSERGKALSNLLFDQCTGNVKPINLTLGKLGTWTLIRDSSVSSKHNLQARTYNQPNHTWASVTPIILDRMPKSDRVNEPLTWREEVAGIIRMSCANVGLPEPIAVRVEKTPFFRGSLRAMPGQGGFPQLRRDRFQVHAVIEFAGDVTGPVLIGAGRFRGYGLMRPWKAGEQ